MRLSESRIVVTGASSGIGKALVVRLLNEGAVVVGIDRDDPQVISDHFSSIIADLSRLDQVRSSYAQAKARLGQIDLYIANAGQARYGSDQVLSEKDTSLLWNLNVLAVVEASRLMREDHGQESYSFVAISSAIAKLPLPGYAFYASTKAAVSAYIQGLRFELPSNQRMHLVYPVATLTDFFKVSGQTHRSWFAQTPHHVAKAIVKGLKTNRLDIYPSFLFHFLIKLFPVALRLYQYRELRVLNALTASNKNNK